MTVVVYYVGLERIRILGETKRFDEKIYAYIFVIFLVPHFWIPFVGKRIDKMKKNRRIEHSNNNLFLNNYF